MLVLSRRAGEGLVVGNSIRIKILEVTSTCVRIGFDAPPEVSIYRDELYAEIAAVTQAAVEDTSAEATDAEAAKPTEGTS